MAKKKKVECEPSTFTSSEGTAVFISTSKTRSKDFIIDDDTPDEKIFTPTIDGITRAHGLVPRQHSIYPPEMFAPPGDMKLIPQSDWDGLIEEQEKLKSSLAHIRGNMPSLDQGQNGYCWSHSTTHCVLLDRAKSNQPYVPLSAYMVAAIIKKGKNEGGWCGLSAKFMREVGICSQSMWPQGDRNIRRDTPEVRANAAKHKILEDWVDLTRNVYDQNLTFAQVASCLLRNEPCALDYNWWSHSVCGMRLVKVEAGSYGVEILNSWTDQWGNRGTGILRGGKHIPDGALAIRATGVSPN